ncbi:beta-galactosidase trimerization domain-containing protein [Lactiplantibacillus plantarum]|nr:beta-galactosidase trimerization domain-containing protein [Lactiplantibacillus plantarum]
MRATDDLTAYDLVIDPMHFMMSAQFATKLKAYVQQGGHLIGAPTLRASI